MMNLKHIMRLALVTAAAGVSVPAWSQEAATAVPAAIAAAQCGRIDARSSDGDVTRAMLMYADRNYTGCLDMLANARAKGMLTASDAELAALYRALATLHLPDRADEGLALIEDFLTTYQTSVWRARAVAAKGDYYFDAGRYAKALSEYKSIDMLTVDKSLAEDIDFRRAYCLLKTDDIDRALSLYEPLCRTSRYGSASRFYVAYVAYCKGEYDRALKLLRQVDTTAAPGNLADCYITQIEYARKEWDAALKTSRKVLSRKDVPDEYMLEATRIAGESLYNTGRRNEAMRMLERYVTATGESATPTARYDLGVCLYESGRFEEALSNLTAVASLDDALGQSASLYAGQCYVALRNTDAAMLAFERAYRRDYDKEVAETAFYNYCVARMQGGKVPFGSTVSSFEEFLQRYPESRYDTAVREYLVYGYMTDNNYAAALESIERLRDKTPEMRVAHQQILYNLGARRMASGLYGDAADALLSASQMNADAATAHQARLLLGDCRYRQGRYADAVKDYRMFINNTDVTTPNAAAARYGLGYALFAQEDYDSAAAAFRQYLDMGGRADKNTGADAINRVADIEYRASRFDRASQLYGEAYTLNQAAGDYPLYRQALIDGYHREYASKTERLNSLMSNYPHSSLLPDVMLELSESYRLSGNKDEGEKLLEQLVERYPATPQSRQAMLLMAQNKLNAGDRDGAMTTYRTLITRHPASGEARTAADALKELYAADGHLSEYVAFVNSIPNGPSIEPDEIDRLTWQSAERAWLDRHDISLVDKYIDEFENGTNRAGAFMYQADKALAEEDDETALNRATVVVTMYPDSPEAVRALLIKGTVEARQGRDHEALATLETLRDKSPDAVTLDAARMGVMRAARRLGRYDKVLEAAESLAGSTNLGSSDKVEVEYSRGLAQARTGEYAAAAATWRAQADKTDELYGVMSAYRLGEMYLDRGKLTDAHRTADALVDSNTPHEYWLAKGFILLSDVLRAQGKTFEADEYLRSLRDNYPGREADIMADIESRLNKSK